MRYTFIMLLLVCAVRPALSQAPAQTSRWTMIARESASKTTYSLDTVSVNQEPEGTIHAWIKVDPDSLALDRASGDLVVYEVEEHRYDCRRQRQMLLTHIKYNARHQAIGTSTFNDSQWTGVAPESVGETLLVRTCE